MGRKKIIGGILIAWPIVGLVAYIAYSIGLTVALKFGALILCGVAAGISISFGMKWLNEH